MVLCSQQHLSTISEHVFGLYSVDKKRDLKEQKNMSPKQLVFLYIYILTIFTQTFYRYNSSKSTFWDFDMELIKQSLFMLFYFVKELKHLLNGLKT